MNRGIIFVIGCANLFNLCHGGKPEQIALNYGIKASEMVVMWAMVDGLEDEGMVRYGSSPLKLEHMVQASGSTHSIYAASGETNDDYWYYGYAINYTSPMIYKATMVGLKPGNNIVYYQVGSEYKGFSKVNSFKTNPGVGLGDVTFHVMGDLGRTDNSIQTMQEILDTDINMAGLSGGIISMGDNSYANRKQYLWDEFENMKEFAAARMPMFSTPGNHEWYPEVGFTFIAYTSRHDNPPVNGKKELYYSFEAGLAKWVMVSGYCPEMKSDRTQPCLAPGSKQLTWLKNELSTVDRTVTPWLFVVFHQPYVNSNQAHSMQTEGQPMQDAIEDLLYQAHVDVVFAGHVHAYERSCRLYKHLCQDDAPLYITIGDGGNAEGLANKWVEPQPKWSLFRQASYGYGELTVVNSTHTRWEWNQNGDLTPKVPDSVWVVKNDRTFTEMAGRGVTGQPRFVDGPRGERAAAFNEKVIREIEEEKQSKN